MILFNEKIKKQNDKLIFKKLKIMDIIINLQTNNETNNNETNNKLMNIKKYKNNNKIYGLVHIQLKYFIKMSNYSIYMSKITEIAEKAFQVSRDNSNSEKIFIFLDLSDMTQKNFSIKFIRQLSKKLNNEYKNTLALCFLYGNISFIRVIWPYIKILLDNDTKQKIILLE